MVQDVLETASASTDLYTRKRALDALIHGESLPGAGGWGPRGAWDPNPWIQLSTARALGTRLPEEQSRAQLREMAQRPGVDAHVRCTVARLLGPQESGWLLPLVQSEYRDGFAGNARISCAVAGLELGDDAALPVLVAALQEDELPLDVLFIRSLAHVEQSTLNAPLEQALEWAEEGFDLELAGVVAHRGSPAGLARLEQGLQSEDELEGLDSLEVILRLPDAQAVQVLRVHRRGDTLAAQGAGLFMGLVHEGKHGVLRESWKSEDPELRALTVEMAAVGLSSRVSGRVARECQDLLSLALLDEEISVRLSALIALGKHATPVQLEALVQMLERTDQTERLEVAMAIRYRMTALKLNEAGGPPAGAGETSHE